MIDLNLLRKDTQKVKKLLQIKDPFFDIDKLIKLDEQVRKLRMEVEELRHKKNELANLGSKKITEQLKEESRQISNELKDKESKLQAIESEFNNLYLVCPNILDETVPQGTKEQNLIIKEIGEKPNFKFEVKNHVDLGILNNWFDFDAAAKIAGSNFALYKGKAVKLVYALMIHMLSNNMKFGYFPILPPYLVNEQSLIAAGNLPKFKEDVYHIEQEDLYLTPTSEVNLTNLYRNNIFLAQDLPIRMTSWTSCFRREAGSYGAAERGLIRIHQFEKLELYTICEPDLSSQEQDRMIECAESILKSLNLHYRISLLAGQDCSFASAKTYDIEVWMPGQGVYKEVSSISNCTDFQARRAGIRFRRSANDKTRLVHTLNGSSLALPRLMVALVETYQQEDGTIEIPDILKSVSIEV